MSNIRKEIGRWVKISLFTFPLSAFVACENEDFVPQDDIGDVVEVTAAIGDAPHTRVSQPEDNKYVFDDKDKIHIVGWHGDWDQYNKPWEMALDAWWNDAVSTYNATSGKWNTEPYMRWQNGDGLDHHFIAWWPENVVESTANLENVNINLTGNYKTDDILLAQEYDKKKPDDNKLNLKFEHLMSRFDVRLQFREYYTDVKDITVSANLYTEATCDFFRRTTQTTGTTKTVNLTESETMQGFYWSGACITVPQEINLHDIGLTINFTAGGEQKQVKLQEARNMTFESGKRIIFNLTIGNDAVVLGNVTQTDWQDVDCDNLKAEECDHNFVNGVCWLCETKAYTYDSSNNTYYVFYGAGLQPAVTEASASGTADSPATVKLMKDMTVGNNGSGANGYKASVILSSGVVVLDLNNCVLTTTSDYASVDIANKAALTIIDSSLDKGGTITGSNPVILNNYGRVTVQNGNFINTCSNTVPNPCVIYTYKLTMTTNDVSVVINGGTFIGTSYGNVVFVGRNTVAGITGGTIKGGVYDICSMEANFLRFDEATGNGPSFPDGIAVNLYYDDCKSLSELLYSNAALYNADGELIEFEDNTTSIAGDVIVKRKE